MRMNEVHIFVFIASLFIGILISLNMNLNNNKKVTFLTTQQYQDAYAQKNSLISDITHLKKQYNSYYDKYLDYKYNENNNNDILKEIDSTLNINQLIMGFKDVEGPGIIIKMEDAKEELNEMYDRMYLVHDFDIWMVINELKNAGAEAISVNGQRIIDGSYDYCGGTFITVDGVKIVPPFYISAIGNVDLLKKYMLSDENYLKELMIVRKINVDLQTYSKIKINAYVGKKNYKYTHNTIEN